MDQTTETRTSRRMRTSEPNAGREGPPPPGRRARKRRPELRFGGQLSSTGGGRGSSTEGSAVYIVNSIKMLGLFLL